MDPVTAFATIVGLVSCFKSERRASSDDEYRDFIAWLSDKRHIEVVQGLASNHNLMNATQALLSRNHDEVVASLRALDTSIVELASRIDAFRGIASALAPNSQLSTQALSILKQLNDSNGSVILEIKLMDGARYQVLDARAGGQIDVEDFRFIDDDLQKLCDLGLLRPDFNSKGGRLFRITRSSVRYLQQLGLVS